MHYADGDVYYTAGGRTNRISSLRAFMLGLPTKLGPYGLRTVLALLPFCVPYSRVYVTYWQIEESSSAQTAIIVVLSLFIYYTGVYDTNQSSMP